MPPSRRRRAVTRLTQHSGSRAELESGATVKIEGKEYPDYVEIGVAYAELIAQEKIPACRYLILSAKRFLAMYSKARSGKGDFYWSKAHAIEPCAFIETLCHVKGVLAKKPIRLEAWQIWIIISIYGFRWKDTGDRVVTIAQLEITRKQGKAEWIENLIPTTAGMKRMADIVVGDIVFAPDGTQTPVVAASPIWMDRPCLEVEFSTGERVVVDEEHEWETRPRFKGDIAVDKSLPRAEWYGTAKRTGVFTTKRIAETLTVGGRGDRNHFIDVASPVELPDQEYSVDPYVLGAWLGDGSSLSAEITIADDEIVEAIAASGESIRPCNRDSSPYLHIVGSNGKSQVARNNSLRARLRKIGVLGNKHIPEGYLSGSIEQRYSLLQGLMDTDGTVWTGSSSSPRCEFTTTKPDLRDGMVRLLGSLGLKPSCREGRATLNGRDCGPKWRICFTAYQDQKIFRLSRKQKKLVDRPERATRSSNRAIVAVREAGRRPTRCIQVAHRSHQYLTGTSFIPTHNSLLAAGIALYELGPNAYIGDDLYIIAPTAALAQKVLEPMKKMVEYNPSLKEHYGIHCLTERIDVTETESYATILSSAGKKQDGHDPKVVIADEFHSLPASIFNVMKSSQGARPESLFLEIGSAGYNAFGVGWDERNTAIEVLEGKRNRPNLFCAIWTIDTKDFGNWRNERVIRKCNPNFGVSTPKRKVLDEIEEIYTSPRNKNETLRTRFNVWGLGESKLISRDQWDLCHIKGLQTSNFSGDPAWVGVDCATRNDMVTWVMEFELDDLVVFFAKHYVPEHGPWREDEEVRDLYEFWHEEGWLTFTPGSFHTYVELERDLLNLCDEFDVKMIAIDDREANALMGALAKEGKPVVSFRKNAPNYSEPTKDIVAKATGKVKGLAHDGNPVLAWNVENVIGGQNTAELILPKKITDHSNMKIDGFDGMCMSHACYMEHVGLSKPHVPQPMAVRGMRIVGNE